MFYIEDIVKDIITKYPCCSVWTVPISSLADREKNFFGKFSPSSKTAVVLGHHVLTRAEWKWYAKESGGRYCAADDHCAEVCKQFKSALEGCGFKTLIVPYPGQSGLQFRFVAQAAGAGEIGINAFLLHPEWGLWIHLRVLATQAESKLKPITPDPVCDECGICVSECPAEAIQMDSFDGLLCRSYQNSKGADEPFGPKRMLRYCEICADACPIGQKPKEI